MGGVGTGLKEVMDSGSGWETGGGCGAATGLWKSKTQIITLIYELNK